MLHQQSVRMGIRVSVMGAVLFALVASLSSVYAQGVSSVAQGFQTEDANMRAGALAGLTRGKPNTVELSTSAKLDQIIGVVGEDSLIELSKGGNSVQVVTSGKTSTLVSDINGAVKVGDRITASPIAGVGMKATGSGLVIGTAQSGFTSVATETVKVKDRSGKEQSVRIGQVQAQIDKVYYEAPEDKNSFLPKSVQEFANSISGHKVSPMRVMLAGALGAVLLVAVMVILYSAIRSSIISIGRNPLSEPAVHKGLFEVGLSVSGVLVFAAIVIYLILTT